ncbi:VIR protein [Plasmodium vivax]|uniref:VIR protein n=1 Tax=Plasmodium vivax TaxID=5855 RepID=A0A1G4E337_PLAVI|nr:VIR protein [Plasmodium vivax]SCA60638.1 VIR protein [Plasmodium vivax]
MSATYQDTFFEELKKKYGFLVDLPIGNLYPLFYSEDMHMEISNSYCNYLPTENYHGVFDDHSICKNAQNILSYLNHMIPANPLYNNNKFCEYLSYYIYENILNCNLCNDIEQLNTELNNLIIYYRKLPNKCNISNFNIGKDPFLKKKELYLLGEILYWIKEKYGSIYYFKQDLFNQFFGECVDIYKKILSADNCNIKNKYETELNNFINNFNNTKKFLSTKDVNITYENLKIPNASRCQEELNGMQAKELPTRGVEQAVNKAGPTRLEVEPLAIVLEEPSLEEVSGSGVGTEDHADHMSGSGSDIPKGQTDDNPSNSAGTIKGTSLGFVVPLITIYKFTPLGSWINTKVLGRNKILKNMEINNQHLLLNGTENGEINLGESMYRIKYNS